MIFRLLTIFTLCASSLFCWAQEDNDTLNTVNILEQKLPSKAVIENGELRYELDSSFIKNSGALNLGQLVQYLPSVSIKDYGGIGGLKTVSIRGMGAQFSTTSIDKVPIFTVGTSAIDLSTIPLFYTNNVSLTIGTQGKSSAYTNQFGGNINVETTGGYYSPKKSSFSTEFNAGSFNTYIFNLGGHFQKGKSQFSYGYQINYSDGNFPYTYKNGIYEVSESREFSEMLLNQIFTDYLFVTSKTYYHLKVAGSYSDQNIPGPIKLYVSQEGQQQETANTFVQHNLEKYYKKWKLHHQFKYQFDFIHYLDTNFSSLSGSYESYNRSNLLFTNVGADIDISKWMTVHVVTDIIGSTMNSTPKRVADPYRIQSNSFVGVEFTFDRHHVSLGGDFVFYAEKNANTDSIEKNNFIQPSINYSFQTKDDAYALQIFGKQSNRLPTFSERYFPIGDNQLKPETAWQLGINNNINFKIKDKLPVQIYANPFYNYVKDKIIGYPNSSLFIWTYFNQGISQSFGTDVGFSLSPQISKDLGVMIQANYTFQKSEKLDDPNSSEYKQPLPYTPEHVVSTTATISYKNYSLGYNFLFYSLRYYANISTTFYELEPLALHDIFVNANWVMKEKHKLNASIHLNNLSNQQYQFVRNYPMPGFNWMLKIRYQLH